MACWLARRRSREARPSSRAGAADYATPEEAVRAFALLATYRRNQALLLETPRPARTPPADRRRAAHRRRGPRRGPELLGEDEAKRC
jgi:acetyltransferase